MKKALALVFAAACAPPAQAPDSRHAAGGDDPHASASRPSYGPEAADVDRRDPKRPARALVFRANGFPTLDAPPVDDAVLDAALAGLPVDRAESPAALDAHLRLRDVDVLVNAQLLGFVTSTATEIDEED